MKIKIEKEKYRDIKFICSCGCNARVMIMEFPEGKIEINAKSDGRKRWSGAVLSREDAKKLRKFLDKS